MAMEQVLLLNMTFEPLGSISWQKAIVLYYKGRVEVVEEYDRDVRSVSFSFKMPAVVRLLRMAKIRKREHVPFTRSNVYARDHYTCQYCGEPGDHDELTFDHVVPVAHGGRRSWTNIVTACEPCNRQKGGRTPEEAGMALRRKPAVPSPSPLMTARITISVKRAPSAWRQWLEA